jgi:uncharacterized protein YjiS (DUF1127 family)
MAALRPHAAKQTKRIVPIGAARTIQRRAIVQARRAAAAATSSPTGHAMLFLDLYGPPRPPARTSSLPRPVQTLVETIAAWKRAAHDRRVLGRMSIRQLEDLQLRWPDDIRDIRAHS